MDEALTIEVRHEPGYAAVTAAGEIDISTVTRLRDCLFELAAGGGPLVVDLEQVSFIDSVGLAVLVGTANRAAVHGGSLYAVCARPKVCKLFRLTGLDSRYRWPAPWTRPGRPWRRGPRQVTTRSAHGGMPLVYRSRLH